MNAALQKLAQGPLTSDPADVTPWLRQVRKGIEPANGGAAGALASALDAVIGGNTPRVTALAVLKAQLLAIHEALQELLHLREELVRRGADKAACERLELLIGAVALAYENLRTGSAADRPLIEKIFKRLMTSAS